MSEDDFRVAFKGSAMKRAKLIGLKRNAAIVVQNFGSEGAAGASDQGR